MHTPDNNTIWNFFLKLIGACSSEYIYTEQPPQYILCDPFQDDILMLDCSATGPDLTDIRWYYSADGIVSPTYYEKSAVLINGTKNSTFISRKIRNDNGISTTLTLRNLSSIIGNSYWCVGVTSTSVLTPSYAFPLQGYLSEFFSDNRCTTSLRDSIEQCADEIPTQETIPVSSSPPSPFVPITQPTSTTVSVALSPTMTHHRTSALPTPEKSPIYVATGYSPSTTVTSPNLLQSSQLWLIIIVGICAFFIAVILLLAVVICILCQRRRRRNEGNLHTYIHTYIHTYTQCKFKKTEGREGGEGGREGGRESNLHHT